MTIQQRTLLNDEDYRALLDLIMCSDPWPVNDEENQDIVLSMAVKEAERRGFDTWVDAYHYLGKATNAI